MLNFITSNSTMPTTIENIDQLTLFHINDFIDLQDYLNSYYGFQNFKGFYGLYCVYGLLTYQPLTDHLPSGCGFSIIEEDNEVTIQLISNYTPTGYNLLKFNPKAVQDIFDVVEIIRRIFQEIETTWNFYKNYPTPIEF